VPTGFLKKTEVSYDTLGMLSVIMANAVVKSISSIADWSQPSSWIIASAARESKNIDVYMAWEAFTKCSCMKQGEKLYHAISIMCIACRHIEMRANKHISRRLLPFHLLGRATCSFAVNAAEYAARYIYPKGNLSPPRSGFNRTHIAVSALIAEIAIEFPPRDIGPVVGMIIAVKKRREWDETGQDDGSISVYEEMIQASCHPSRMDNIGMP
jgi:hypothetical protein